MKVYLHSSDGKVFSGRFICSFLKESPGTADSVAGQFRFPYLGVLYVHGRAKGLRENKLRQYVVNSCT